MATRLLSGPQDDGVSAWAINVGQREPDLRLCGRIVRLQCRLNVAVNSVAVGRVSGHGMDDRSAPAALDRTELAAFVGALRSGDVRIVADIEAEAFAEDLATGITPDRPVLLLELGAGGDAAAVVCRAVAQLSTVVAGLWPFLWGGEDFSDYRDDAQARAHLPIRLAGLAGRVPGLSTAWARSAASNLLRGLTPRVDNAPTSLEWPQLVLSFCPTGLTIAAPCRPDEVDEAWVGAVEWLARHGEVAVVVLAGNGAAQPALQRVAFGARRVVSPAQGNAFAMPESVRLPTASGGPAILSLPRVEGAPHPQSAIELTIWRLVQADEELRPLLLFNRTVPEVAPLEARADILWREGRIVVEIDGVEHRRAVHYRRDRHRDYKLMCAGYRVLRITNEEVAEDAALVLEKIRDVVRLARREPG